MQIRYVGLKKGTFQRFGRVTRQYYSFNARSLSVQEVDDRDAVEILTDSNYERVWPEASAPPPPPPPPPPAALPEPVIPAPQLAPPVPPPMPVPPSARPKATARDLKEFEAKAVPERDDWPMDDFAALLGLKAEVSDAMQSAGLFTLLDVEQAGDEELLAIRGIGPATLDKIRREIRERRSAK